MPNTITIICPICQNEALKNVGAYNRAKKGGYKVYCSKSCSGIGRRLNKSDEQKKKEKAEYDKKHRDCHREDIKKKKAEAFRIDYAANPEKYKKERERRYSDHLKYLQRPEYKEYKKDYDKKHRAKKEFGEFWESALLIDKIEKELPNDREIRQINNLHNKSQKRKRSWQQKS